MQEISANNLPINYAVNLTLLHKGEVSKIKKREKDKKQSSNRNSKYEELRKL